jgi:hypothetical protein
LPSARFRLLLAAASTPHTPDIIPQKHLPAKGRLRAWNCSISRQAHSEAAPGFVACQGKWLFLQNAADYRDAERRGERTRCGHGAAVRILVSAEVAVDRLKVDGQPGVRLSAEKNSRIGGSTGSVNGLAPRGSPGAALIAQFSID